MHVDSNVAAAVWEMTGVIVGAVVGALSSAGTAWLAALSTARMQMERLASDRDARGRDFQAQTLIELQEALHELLRLATRVQIEDEAAFAATSVWGKNILPDNLSESFRIGQRRVAILRERVRDDGVRLKLDQLTRELARGALATSKAEALSIYNGAAIFADSVLREIGSAFRATY